MHIDLCHLPARHALVIHTNCPATSVSATMRKLFADVAMWAAGHGVRLSGPAVARYDEKADGRCVLDAGYFVDRPIAVDDAHKEQEIPEAVTDLDITTVGLDCVGHALERKKGDAGG